MEKKIKIPTRFFKYTHPLTKHHMQSQGEMYTPIVFLKDSNLRESKDLMNKSAR